MALDIPGGLFEQSDVRETPVSTATATSTSVGLTDGKYVVVDYHADMSDERKITEGTGIDFTDNGANGTFVIALKNKTSYWSATGLNFLPENPPIQDYQYNGYDYHANADNLDGLCPVFLPQGAVVTAVIVYGSSSTETFYLRRHTLLGGALGTMGTTTVNSEDSTISLATIDNSLYSYGIDVQDLQTGDDIYGARITYTTDYI